MSGLEPFGPGSAWLAVRDRTQADVAEALGLTDGRAADPGDIAAAGARTVILPPLPGVGGSWTLAVGDRLARTSPRRLETLAAMLGTEVQLHDALAADDAPEVLRRAAAGSIDPSTLAGPYRGNVLLFDDVDEGPPPREQVKTPSRTPWLWTRLTRRRATIAPRDDT
ncbi:hypothetical protein DUHN55_13790 [Helicobacter pylori]